MAKTSIRQSIMALGVGEGVSYQLDGIRTSTLRNYASILGLELGRDYSVNVNRELRVANVIRNN